MKKSFAYLGPKGTFTEAAFLQMPIAQGAELVPAESVRAALNMVRAGEVFGALVPIENSVEGSVATTLDELGHGDLAGWTRQQQRGVRPQCDGPPLSRRRLRDDGGLR